MQLFYNPKASEEKNEIAFPRDESKHIIKVLRKKEGDILHISNGRGTLFTTQIISANQNSCLVKTLSVEKSPSPAYHLHLVVAPTKMNDRYEWFLEKATEIGVQEITPIICEHSERKMIKKDRFERVLQSAMKQSLHTFLPVLNDAITFKEFLKKDHPELKYIAHCQESEEKQLFSKEFLKNSEVIILIGPEGDFSNEEINLALENNWKPVSLGNSRLRTETAAVVACHSVAIANES